MKKNILLFCLFLFVSSCLIAQKSIGIKFGPVYENIKFIPYYPYYRVVNKGKFIGINIETFSKEKISFHSGISYMGRSYNFPSLFAMYGTSMHAKSVLIENGMKYFVYKNNCKTKFYLNINFLLNFHFFEGYSVDGLQLIHRVNDFKLYNLIFSTGVGVNFNISERISSKIEFNFGMPLFRNKNNTDFNGLLEEKNKQHPPVLHNNLVFGLSYKIKKHEKE